MSGAAPALTMLYVPADRPDRIAKALGSGADVVAVDLEDAVVATRKAEARAAVLDALAEQPEGVDVQVRVNAPRTRWHDDDLAALAQLPSSVDVRVPKVESAADVRVVSQALPGRGVHALLETALAVENAFGIAVAGIRSLSLGEADLRSQLGLPRGSEGDIGLAWARARVVNAAAAAGLRPPMMSVHTNVRDLDGLRDSSRHGRRVGFLGRSAVHPAQLPVIREAFAPSDDEVSRAEEILVRVGAAEADGAGVVVLDDGSFLDAAMVAGARRTVAIASRIRSSQRNA